ncbi:MAG: SUMF1/EgtB/PvdO family nonheme iron enzyme [Spirochaetales bacterium]|nr:SUMF1/EgtB/PvdO family nonheme iron enzyme [Spirochaetales bacterium]
MLLSGIILAVCLVCCTTEAGSAGANGKDGKDGQNGIGITWMGSRDYPPDNPQLNWAYYNYQERISYIYDGTSWQILAEGGEQGISISWMGERSEAPSDPELNWAYYNTTDKKSYIFDGYDWQILAKDGEDGVSIKWVGEFSEHPYNPETGTAKKGWAYYNTAEKKTYLYDGSTWQILARDGNDGAGGGSDGQNGVGIVWKGELDEAPYDDETGSPKLNWAYYDTNEKKSYIYDGSNWQILAQDGKDGQSGNDGISILWKGSLTEAPNDPTTDWAYYNTTDKKSYIFDGTDWQVLAQDGNDAKLPSYTVRFSANGGVGEINDDWTVLCHAPILIQNKCTKEEFSFVRWCINQNGTGKSYRNGDIAADLTGDGGTVTLYAIWKDDKNYIDESGDMVIGETKHCKTSLVPVLTKETVIPCDQNDGAFVTVRGSVRLSPYSIGKYEVTQELFNTVMEINPSYNKVQIGEGETNSLLRPVEQVSWYDAITFCNKLSLLMGRTPCYSVDVIDDWGNLPYSSIPERGNEWDGFYWIYISCNWETDGYRLPTDCEWECAARGGIYSEGISDPWNYIYSGSNDLDNIAWYRGNSLDIRIYQYRTWEVGLKNPNTLVLYDMSGNVSEWCWDWYDVITSDTGVTGPVYEKLEIGSSSVSNGDHEVKRTVRNGHYGSGYQELSVLDVTHRYVPNGWYYSGGREKDIGFRIACTGK